MIRTSTPTHTFECPFIVGDYMKKMSITYAQIVGGKREIVIEKTENDIGTSVKMDKNTIVVNLTQEETKKFKVGDIFTQIKIWTNEGKSVISEKITLKAEDVLNDEVFI